MNKQVAEDLYAKWVRTLERLIGKGATTTSTLNTFGYKLLGRSRFSGVYAVDRMPGKFNSCIVNLDTSGQPGSHWVAVARNGEKYMVYDSFGRSTPTIIKRRYLHNKTTVDTESDAEQEDSESNCGVRCLAWLLLFHSFGADAAMKI